MRTIEVRENFCKDMDTNVGLGNCYSLSIKIQKNTLLLFVLY